MNKQSDHVQAQELDSAGATGSRQDLSLLEEQVRLLYSNAPASIVTAILVAVIVAAAIRDYADPLQLCVWIGIMIAVNLGRAVLVHIYCQEHQAGQRVLQWRAWYLLGVLCSGLAWGSLGLLLDLAWPVEYQVLVFMSLSGIAAGAISSYAIIFSIYAVYVIPIMVLLVSGLMMEMTRTSVVMVPLVILFTTTLLLIAHKHSRVIIKTLVLGGEKQQLVNTATTTNIRLQEEIRRYTDVEKEMRLKNAEIEQAHQDLAQSHQQTLQSEKLASVGQLAAGIAHEINTPIQFVGDNTRFLQESFADLMRLVTAYEAMGKADGEDGVPAELAEKARSLSEEIEVDYLEEEVPKAIAQSLEGIDRVSRIVRSMKDFSHPGSDKKEIIDINQSIESTVTVSRNEWKYHAELVTDFDEVLKAVPCFPGELNQVVLNMIVNASHAIADVNDGDTGTQGIITISTRLAGGFAEIRIGDTGTGMTEEIRNRIFEPFFTTKGVGKGSGQGLAIAYAVVVEKHKGSIDVESEPGKGTTFIIRLPMRDSTDDAETNTARSHTDEETHSVCG